MQGAHLFLFNDPSAGSTKTEASDSPGRSYLHHNVVAAARLICALENLELPVTRFGAHLPGRLGALPAWRADSQQVFRVAAEASVGEPGEARWGTPPTETLLRLLLPLNDQV